MHKGDSTYGLRVGSVEEGESVGISVGLIVGERLGDSVGVIVGNSVVGESVGSWVWKYEKRKEAIRNLHSRYT